MSSTGGWCGRGDKPPRTFPRHSPVICYDAPAAARVNRHAYDTARHEALTGARTQDFVVPKMAARTWTMQKGDLCRVSVIEGSQVGDINMWNLDDTTEHFYSGKTRQLHATHLTVYDRLWSNLPYLRPLATVVADSLKDYGVDEDGGSVHDVIGTRCDDYTYQLITGRERHNSCHTHLTHAVKEDTHQYFCKPSPARKGDYIEFIADMNLLVALCACPQGDVSVAVGQEVPDSICHPLGVEVFRANT